MKRILKLSFICFVILFLMGVKCNQNGKVFARLDLELVPQHTNRWCWAACTEAISAFYGHRVLQCASSQYIHNNPTTCKDCSSFCTCWNACSASIDNVKKNWTHWKFNYSYLNKCLTFNEIKDAIYSKKSPIFVIWWYPTTGHVVTIYEYLDLGDDLTLVAYRNPWPPDCSNPTSNCNTSVSGGEDAASYYDTFVDDGNHRWGDTFYNFSYSND